MLPPSKIFFPGRRAGLWLIRSLPWLLVAPLFLLPFAAAVLAGPASLTTGDQSVGDAVERFFRLLGSPSIMASLRFSLLQALFSTFCSLALGLPGAWLLAHFRFPGRRIYAALGGIPFVFPPVLFTVGFVRAWGHNGIVNTTLMNLFGLAEAPFNLTYSFWGIVMAHTLLNFPLVVGLVANVWRRVPRSPADAARLLGAGEARIFRTISLPAILPGIAAAASLVFLYCFMSFAIPLTLGGGPEYATLEVSIYAAVSGGQDFARAGSIALLQGICTIGVLILYTWLNGRSARAAGVAKVPTLRLAAEKPLLRCLASLWLLLSASLALSPLLALLVSSFTGLARWGGAPAWSVAAWGKLFSDPENLRALVNSLFLAGAVAVLGVGIAVLLLIGERRSGSAAWRSVFFALPVALSSIMLSLGYLVLLPLGAGMLVLAIVQASAAYPVAWRSLGAARSRIPDSLESAAVLLGAGRGRVLATIDFPLLRQSLLSSLALCAAISLGEINAALMLNPPDFPLLGLRAYRLMGSYQYPLACAIGVVVCGLAGLAFAAADGLSDEGALKSRRRS